jgi:hypothetical protein
MEAIAHAAAAAANTRIEIRFIGRFIGPPCRTNELRCLTRRIVVHSVRRSAPFKETTVHSEDSSPRHISWGLWIAVAVGSLLFLLGVARFVLRHRFVWTDALYCCLAVLPAALLHLVFDYVLHHARLASIVVVLAAAMLLFTFPVFDVALGLAILGTIGGPALTEWRTERRRTGRARDPVP